MPEVYHLVVVDLVDFSRRSFHDQLRSVKALEQRLIETATLQSLDRGRDLVWMSTGDGAIIAFRKNFLAPLQLATELRQDTISISDLRVGVHSGLASEYFDSSERLNLIGPGVNEVARVGCCAEPGQIVVSAAYAKQLAYFDEWRMLISPVGVRQVKKDRISFHLLYTRVPKHNPYSSRLSLVVLAVVSVVVTALFIAALQLDEASKQPLGAPAVSQTALEDPIPSPVGKGASRLYP